MFTLRPGHSLSDIAVPQADCERARSPISTSQKLDTVHSAYPALPAARYTHNFAYLNREAAKRESNTLLGFRFIEITQDLPVFCTELLIFSHGSSRICYDYVERRIFMKEVSKESYLLPTHFFFLQYIRKQDHI